MIYCYVCFVFIFVKNICTSEVYIEDVFGTVQLEAQLFRCVEETCKCDELF